MSELTSLLPITIGRGTFEVDLYVHQRHDVVLQDTITQRERQQAIRPLVSRKGDARSTATTPGSSPPTS